MNNSEFSSKIVFKVKLDQEIKKIVIHNDEINYNELLLMMQRIFSDRIRTNDEFVVKYTDEENDLITLSNDSDVSLALQNSKTLKLTILLPNNGEDKASEEEIRPGEILRELSNIRSSIDKFLDKFDRYLKLESNLQKLEETSKRTTTDVTKPVNAVTSTSNTINNDLSKEFDPLTLNNKSELNDARFLHNQQQQQKLSRAETPNSITEFSDGHHHNRRLPSTNQDGFVSSTQQQKHSLESAQVSSSAISVEQHQQQPLASVQPVQAQQFSNVPLSAPQTVQQSSQPQQQFHPALFNQQPSIAQQNLPAQNQYYVNPSALKAPMPIQSAANQLQAQQNPAISSSQPPFLPANVPPSQLHQGLPQPNVETQKQHHFTSTHQHHHQQQQQQHQHQLYGQYVSGVQGMPPNQPQPQQQQQQQPNLAPNVPPTYPGMNPYAKMPGQSLARPPSATLYQQGYN